MEPEEAESEINLSQIMVFGVFVLLIAILVKLFAQEKGHSSQLQEQVDFLAQKRQAEKESAEKMSELSEQLQKERDRHIRQQECEMSRAREWDERQRQKEKIFDDQMAEMQQSFNVMNATLLNQAEESYRRSQMEDEIDRSRPKTQGNMLSSLPLMTNFFPSLLEPGVFGSAGLRQRRTRSPPRITELPADAETMAGAGGEETLGQVQEPQEEAEFGQSEEEHNYEGQQQPAGEPFGSCSTSDSTFGTGSPGCFGMGSAGLPSFGMGSPGMPSFGMGSPGMPSFGMGSQGMPSFGMGSPGMPSFGMGSPNMSQFGSSKSHQNPFVQKATYF